MSYLAEIALLHGGVFYGADTRERFKELWYLCQFRTQQGAFRSQSTIYHVFNLIFLHSVSDACSFLANAELSPYSRSHRILPRSIYLPHEFSFYALATITVLLFIDSILALELRGCKIKVRRNVEVSAYSAALGNCSLRASQYHFIFAVPHHPVPIRNMATDFGDSVSEGLGRIRLEKHKVRSPWLGPRPDVPGLVPLE